MTAHQSFWSLVSIAGQAFAAAERERLRKVNSCQFNSDGVKMQKWIERVTVRLSENILIWRDLLQVCISFGEHDFTTGWWEKVK